jgi:hypothetical protein
MSVDMVKYIRLLDNLKVKIDKKDDIHTILEQINNIQYYMELNYNQDLIKRKWFVPKNVNDNVIPVISKYLQKITYPLLREILENHRKLTTESELFSRQSFMRKSKRKTKSKKSCNNSRNKSPRNKSHINRSPRNKSRRNRLRRSK